ncbi:MAG TPA: DegT/DnrJ/EryC1/StrS family aminotransferase [Blastocatellia bacterium]|nr:DegT/DnrJ/EryC1/StrS family aminotransferase [Blastocatellia bacterium]
MNNFLPFALPDIGEEEIDEVVDSLRSGWLTTGPKTQRFEREFADFIGSDVQALAVNSATAGLHLVLEAFGIGPGDEVITTPYTFTATAGVVRHLGADPVFVDIDPKTFNLDPAKIERAITERTKAIIPVHFAGLACDMQPIIEIARRYGLKILEDAAHALPSTYHNHLIGTLDTDATVFSFYATKTITTGEGGMIVTRDEAIADRCRAMRLHGISRDAFDRYTSTKPAWHYEVIAPGFKYNLTDIASSIGLQQLKKAWAFQERRQEMAERYDAELAKLPITLPPQPENGDLHSWHLYAIRLNDSAGISRDEFIQQMSARGIGCSVHFIPLHLHPYWQKAYDLQPHDFPAAWRAYEQAVSLPLYTKMTEDDQTRVIEAVKDVLAGSRVQLVEEESVVGRR